MSIAAIRGRRSVRRLLALCIVAGLLAGGSSTAVASGPNIVAQWDKIAEDTVVGSGAQQIEALIYLSYTQTAVYDAVVAIKGRYQPYGPSFTAPAGASAHAAVVEAAYRQQHCGGRGRGQHRWRLERRQGHRPVVDAGELRPAQHRRDRPAGEGQGHPPVAALDHPAQLGQGERAAAEQHGGGQAPFPAGRVGG